MSRFPHLVREPSSKTMAEQAEQSPVEPELLATNAISASYGYWRIRLGVLETSEIGFSNHPQAGPKSQGIGLALQNPFLRLENRPIEFGKKIR